MQHEGEILRRLLKSADLTHAEFADKIGVTRVTVGNLINRQRLTEDWKLKICEALAISKDAFAGKDLPTSYPINEDPSHVLTVAERDALWRIINTQKDIIARLEAELKSSKD